jgi:threonine synthase
MRYFSTRDPSLFVSFEQAVMGGMNASGGLFMPESLPSLTGDDLDRLRGAPFPELAFAVVSPFVGDEIPKNDLREIVFSAFDFPLTLKTISPGESVLELFHGPSCAFKDFGARFMARTMAYFLKRAGSTGLHIIVATSGDTGSAVGSAFLGLPNFAVTILYPQGKISHLQEKQLSTFSGNVQSLSVDGSFDDCQRLVKTAFTDEALRQQVALSSANSINIARLIPQSSYYAWASLQAPDKPYTVMVVPSGNFGNLTAGLFAAEMGFPIDAFVAATNANKTVPEYLQTGEYHPRSSVATISNAMDVGAPSNFERMQNLYGLDAMRDRVTGLSVSEEETRAALRACLRATNYMLEPHGAVGYSAWKKLEADFAKRAQAIGKSTLNAVLLETAHPAKFSEVVEEETGVKPPLPERLAAVLSRPDKSIPMKADYSQFRQYLLGAKSEK